MRKMIIIGIGKPYSPAPNRANNLTVPRWNQDQPGTGQEVTSCKKECQDPA